MGDEDLRGEVGAFARQALMELGYQAVWVKDAQAALAEIEASGPRDEVVFSDVVMPEMNGVDRAREIRRRWPYLPVVLTTATSSAGPCARLCGSVRLRLSAGRGCTRRKTAAETASARRPVR